MKLAKIIAKNLVKYGKAVGVKSCTLIKVTPGTRTPGHAAEGTNPSEASYAAKGWIEDYSATQITGTLVKQGDRKVSLLGATIAGGKVPAPGDKILIADASGAALMYRIVPDGVKGDGVGAVYMCQVRA